MKRKIFNILVVTLLILTVLPATMVGSKINIDYERFLTIKIDLKISDESNLIIDVSESTNIGDTTAWETIYENGFEDTSWNDTGAFEGPDLWHITSVDSWSGDNSLGCFAVSQHYVNNMFYNYVLGPTLNMEDVEEMVMDFYCKFITEDEDDHWGIAIYDPGIGIDSKCAHVWTASQTWKHLPYETYGYHPTWFGPNQPMGIYQSFDIKSAYENWYAEGYFRDSQGHRSYDIKIGFVFYESDESGYMNDEAEAHGIYWSGLFIDDISIKQLVFNNPPQTPNEPTGPLTGITNFSYHFSTSTIDPNDDNVKYGWDWNGDGNVDDWSGFYSSGSSCSMSHSWTTAGTYNVKVKAEDSNGAQSDFSSPKTVAISDNNPPNKPSMPSGPTSGKTGTSCSYSSSTTDQDGDQLYYLFNWGDGTDSGWRGPYNSGDVATEAHSWSANGTYPVKVKAKDDPNGDGDLSDGTESVWSDPLSVTMPKNKAINTPYGNPSNGIWFVRGLFKFLDEDEEYICLKAISAKLRGFGNGEFCNNEEDLNSNL
jgi:hypothetical protein